MFMLRYPSKVKDRKGAGGGWVILKLTMWPTRLVSCKLVTDYDEVMRRHDHIIINPPYSSTHTAKTTCYI